jgi:hypothetical protein
VQDEQRQRDCDKDIEILSLRLRFSSADLTAIVAAAQTAGTRRRTRRTRRPDPSRWPDGTDRPDRR